MTEHLRTEGEAMTEQYPPADHQHVPDCDDYAFSGAGWHPTCERSCICRQVARVEHRMIGEAVQRVEALCSLDPSWDGTNWNNALHAAIAAIKGDQP